jgi:hypothetical protein
MQGQSAPKPQDLEPPGEMKKKKEKLVLNRETLMELDRNSMRPVGGGVTYPICDFSIRNPNCYTTVSQCTTNLC